MVGGGGGAEAWGLVGPGGRARGGTGGEGRLGAAALVEVVVGDGVGLGGIERGCLFEVVLVASILLYGVRTVEPGVAALALLVLAGAAAVAVWVPARRRCSGESGRWGRPPPSFSLAEGSRARRLAPLSSPSAETFRQTSASYL